MTIVIPNFEFASGLIIINRIIFSAFFFTCSSVLILNDRAAECKALVNKETLVWFRAHDFATFIAALAKRHAARSTFSIQKVRIIIAGFALIAVATLTR